VIALAGFLPAWSWSYQAPAKQFTEKQAAVDDLAIDEQLLRGANIRIDGPSLLQWLRDRTFPDPDPQMQARLSQQLGDPKYAIREKAFKDLLDIGTPALDILKNVIANPRDLEVRQRAIDLRRRIEERAETAIPVAVARLIGRGKPGGAADALLAYLPFAAPPCRSCGAGTY
jgi:hypothetical protein